MAGSLLLIAFAGAVLWLPATGSGDRTRTATLSIGQGIQANFDSEQRATTYSVPAVNDDDAGAKCCQYAWTLTISAPAGQVDPSLPVDPGCNNHGISDGTGTTFTWEHSNKGDPNRDDGCDHSIYGKFGHQGLITVTVSDDKGWECTATYKGTLSNEQNAILGQQAASTPDCHSPAIAPPPPPPPPPCKCSQVEAFLNNFHIFGVGTTRIEFDVKWQITCTAGAGAGCKGRVDVLAPRGANFLSQGGKTLRPAKPVIAKVDCSGPCAKATQGKETLQYVAFQTVVVNGKQKSVPNPRFTPEGRANKSFTIKLGLICISPTGVPGFPKTETLTLKFDRLGQVDYKNSDLNGDGSKDKGQLRGF
ncbi:MAG TPA: hypothetical protein VHS03_05935 [Gaiellaceae bacterium]|nr:hypothetical protein [Gaiellaceae bacterium]